MSQALKKRLSTLKKSIDPPKSGVIFLTALKNGRYEVLVREGEDSQHEKPVEYRTKKEADEAVSNLTKRGNYVIFLDDMNFWDN